MPGYSFWQVFPLSSSITSDPIWRKDNPYPAQLLRKDLLTSVDAVKQVLHIELDLGDSGLRYQPGDSVSLRILNDPQLVQEVLHLCALAGDDALAHALCCEYELTQVHPGFLKHYAAVCPNEQLKALQADPQALRVFLEHRQIVDVLREFPCRLQAEQLLGCLRRLQERQYSIASSQRRHASSVALTVGLLQFIHDGRQRSGAGSSYLANRLVVGSTVLMHIVSNANFRLPADLSTPVIMIGPGTGIAPFRAFLQEREAQSAPGKNWLFTGNRRKAEDFLYGSELEAWLRSGLLTRLDTAFSRDNAEKMYVQHLLQRHGGDVFAWLEAGAHVYVCGDAKHMAEDVQKTLLEIIERRGKLSADASRQYLVKLRQQRRYQRDVY